MIKPCIWYDKGRCRVTRGKCTDPRNVNCRTYEVEKYD